tara:strand:- start:136 stop:687 length:552 start_codon:yes stop_codon:yes gene_type:complete
MGAGISQNYASIYWQEYYIESNRFEYVVEIGSQKGSLTTYLANMAAITESYVFDTFEKFPHQDWYNRPVEGVGHWVDKLNEISSYINVHHGDIFDKRSFDHIKENVEQFKTYMFCDGGDKAAEFNMYAPILKSGDKIAVHDWGMEITMDQIQETCDKHGLVIDEPFAQSATDLETWIMPFKKL